MREVIIEEAGTHTVKGNRLQNTDKDKNEKHNYPFACQQI